MAASTIARSDVGPIAIADGPVDRITTASSSRITPVASDRSSSRWWPVFAKSKCRSSTRISQVIPAGAVVDAPLRRLRRGRGTQQDREETRGDRR